MQPSPEIINEVIQIFELISLTNPEEVYDFDEDTILQTKLKYNIDLRLINGLTLFDNHYNIVLFFKQLEKYTNSPRWTDIAIEKFLTDMGNYTYQNLNQYTKDSRIDSLIKSLQYKTGRGPIWFP